MLHEDIDGEIDGHWRLRLVEGDALRKTEGQSFLMGVFAEDETLPVDPRVEVIAGFVDKDLKAHLRVLREVNLGIHHGFDEAVISTTIKRSEDEIHTTHLSLCSQERQ